MKGLGRAAIVMTIAALSLLLCAPAGAQTGTPQATPEASASPTFRIGFVRQLPEQPPWIAPLAQPPDDLGIAGAELGIRDNLGAGRFLKLDYRLESEVVPTDGDPVTAARKLVDAGSRYLLLDVPAAKLLEIADTLKDRDVMILNVGATDDRLRQRDCRANVFHIAPSRAMLADGLAQFLVAKRWRNWFLMTGRTDGDRLYAEAIRRSAKKFGAKIVAEKTWDFGPDARQTGQSEIPLVTQVTDHDVVVIADELGEFGDLIPYNTWYPRPVAGTQGLMPLSWHETVENWGASQLQSRFFKGAGRLMRTADYQAWQGVAAIGAAGNKTRNSDVRTVHDFMLSDKYDLPVFKGVAASWRPWDHQLRQPIVLAHATNVVTLSPQQGFLHQRTPLDTLGFDKPESACTLDP